MKTRRLINQTKMKLNLRQEALLIAVLVAGLLNAAAPSDLKTFSTEESYVVQGASIVLTQKVGEATAQVGAALKDSNALTAANGRSSLTTASREMWRR